MSFLRKLKLSGSSILLLGICLVVIIAILLMNIINNKNLSALRQSFDTLSKPNTTIQMLRNTDQQLLVGENKFRIYLSTGDTAYKLQFIQHIDSTVKYLNLIKISEDSTNIKQILRGLGKKIELSDAIIQLKKLSDSVSQTIGNKNAISIYNQPLKVEKISTNILQKYYVRDTVKAVAEKKGFFKKLGALFSNKDNTNYKYVAGDSSRTAATDSTKAAMDESLANLSSEIQKFYQGSLDRELSIRRKLNESEKNLAETNLSIIDDINLALENVLQKEEMDERIRNNTALVNAVNARDSIKNISSVSFAIILIIVIILIFNIARTMRYEKDIVAAKERAEKLAVTKTRYLNNMSHEIRTPLTSIIGFTEQVIKMEYDEDKKKYLEAIRTSSDHLLSTVNDILDFSKLEAGKLDLQKRQFNLCSTIEEVAYAFSITAEKKGIHLHLNMLVDKDLVVAGDDFRLKQILYNLTSNAIKFTEQGNVTITASALWGTDNNVTLKLEVLDSGVGIPDDQLSMIFEEFVQASNTNTNNNRHRAIRGTGLGLPICKMLVEMQHGTIAVQSEIDKGSLFTVNIPYELVKEDALNVSEDKISAATAYAPSYFYGKKALVVEDNEMNIMLLVLLLKKYAFEYDVAKDGEEAVNLYSNNYYDIVLTDINIPKITGDQFASIIRNDENLEKANVPIVALTASVVGDDIDSYMRAGVSDVLVKPFKESEFLAMVKKHLEREFNYSTLSE